MVEYAFTKITVFSKRGKKVYENTTTDSIEAEKFLEEAKPIASRASGRLEKTEVYL